MTLDPNRIGTFVLHFEAIESADKDFWASLMGEVVIVHAEVSPPEEFGHQVCYTAISDRFSELAEDAEIPLYEFTWNREEGHFTWRRTGSVS